MKNNKTFIGIIPARGGSKGLPGKNIKELCGKPLIAWTIETALRSKYLDEVMVSTDDEPIMKIAKNYNANVPFLRPKELAEDETPMFTVIEHTIKFYKNTLKKEFDYIVHLEPTSPLRENDDIDNMIDKIINSEERFDAIISIGEIQEHPSIVKKTVNERIEPFCENLKPALRRQDNEPAYFPYGVAYIIKTETFLKEKTFYPSRTTYYKIKRYQCYEIDDIFDFLAIENIIRYIKNI